MRPSAAPVAKNSARTYARLGGDVSSKIASTDTPSARSDTGVYHRPSIARCVANCPGSLAAGPAPLGPWAEESPEYQGEPPYQDRCEREALPEVKVLAMNRYLCWALLAFFGLIQ